MRRYEIESGKKSPHRKDDAGKEPQTLISTGGAPTALQLTRSCNFSMNTNVKIVCGLWHRGGCQSQRYNRCSVREASCYSRQAQPGGRPALHQEQGALVAQALSCYLEEALFCSSAELHLVYYTVDFREDKSEGKK